MNGLLSVIVIAVGLAMDAFAVSLVSGAIYRHINIKHSLRIALFFGGFQAFMPLVGYAAALSVKTYIVNYDHWVAFLILSAVGSKMIYESFKFGNNEKSFDPSKILTLLILSIATSIDALAIGITLPFLKVSVFPAVVIIGLTTFVISYMGVFIGKRFGHFFESWIETFGGLILIGLAVKILAGHLTA